MGLLPTPGALADPEVPRIEFFTGFESSYTSAYVGGGYAFGKGFHQESLRLRAVGSLGRYHYDSSLESDGVWVPTRFDGDASFVQPWRAMNFISGGSSARSLPAWKLSINGSTHAIQTTPCRGARWASA